LKKTSKGPFCRREEGQGRGWSRAGWSGEKNCTKSKRSVCVQERACVHTVLGVMGREEHRRFLS
jgi:hypothetical protein